MLLNYGASANITDRKKNSPLILAASAGYSGSCRALLDHGANSAYRNILGGYIALLVGEEIDGSHHASKSLNSTIAN